jgi:hypothetical protein
LGLKIAYAGIPLGRTIVETVVAACALAMNESTRVVVSFMAEMKVQQLFVRQREGYSCRVVDKLERQLAQLTGTLYMEKNSLNTSSAAQLLRLYIGYINKIVSPLRRSGDLKALP